MDQTIQPLVKRSTVWLESIQHGFIVTLPVVILGAFSLTLLQMLVWFAPHLQTSLLADISSAVQQGVYGFMAFILALSVSYKLARCYQQKYDLSFDPLVVALLSMVCLAGMVYMDYGSNFHQNLGMPAIAKSLFCSLVLTELFVCFSRYRIVRFIYNGQILRSDLHLAMQALWPAIIAPACLFLIYSMLSSSFSLLGNGFVSLIGQADPQSGLSAWQSVKVILVNQLSWFLGIHGSSFIEMYGETVFPADPEVVYSRQFINIFVHIGGAGGTLGLVLAILFSRNRGHRQLGRYALIPSLFNINELIIFGLPIIFNRFMLVPFLVVPIATATLFRLCFEMDWIQWKGEASIWSTPVFLGGYLATGQWQGVLLQIVCIAISFACYWPWLKLHEQYQVSQESKRYQKMLSNLNNEVDLTSVYYSQSSLARFSRQLLSELKVAITKNQLELYYQPKVNGDQKVVGCEALLRWHHERLGAISPALIVELAEISGDIHELGEWVIDRCLHDIGALEKEEVGKIKFALNVSPVQLNNPNFLNILLEKTKAHAVTPSLIELEITEGQKIDISDALLSGMQKLSAAGFSIAVDDFGMGYTSLRYLKTFPVNTLKIDGSIVKDVLTSHVAKEIIGSMGALSHSMNVQLVAEWVETRDQLFELRNLGCDQFQGKYMSMPIPLHEFIEFCRRQGIEL